MQVVFILLGRRVSWLLLLALACISRLSLVICSLLTLLVVYNCGASVASEQQHKQKNILKDVRILEFFTFYQNALHLTIVHCAHFYQSALRYEQLEFSFPVDSSEND